MGRSDRKALSALAVVVLATFFGACTTATETRQAAPARPGQEASAGPRALDPGAAALVRYAYFTAPRPKTEALAADAQRPPDVRTFERDSPVTFFFGVMQTGRVLAIETRWFDPSERLIREIDETVGQAEAPGAWTMRMQTVQGGELMTPGTWNVELTIDGRLAGRYSFVRR